MIEKIIQEYLNKNLEVPVYAEEPEDPESSYLLFEKTGSSENNLISSAVITVQSYGKSLYEAARLNAKVKEHMRDIVVNQPEVSRCKLNSDYNYTDTETKRYRYQAVFDITFYEE